VLPVSLDRKATEIQNDEAKLDRNTH